MGKKKNKSKKIKNLTASGGWSAPAMPFYDLPVFKAPRGGINYHLAPGSMSKDREVINMGVSISKLAQVASLIAFGAAVFGNVIFGHGGLELVSAGLFLHVGGDLIEDVISE